MSKSVRVQFEDGTSHVYDDVPDDVDNSKVEARAQEEFGKSILTAHSPNQGSAPGARPAESEKGPVAPSFADYSTLPQSAGQIAGAAQVPIQLAAEHPTETAAALGLYKAGQVANAYVGGKQAEAEAARRAAELRAQAQQGHQAIQQQKINAKVNPVAPTGVAPTGPVAPSQIVGADGRPIMSQAGQAAQVAEVEAAKAAQAAQAAKAAATAEQTLPSRIKQKAASMITGLAEASPMLAGAGRMAGKVLPGAGLALGATEAYNRAQQGDYLGAGLAGVGGVAGLVPGVGTAVNLGTTGINAARDYQKYLEAKRQYEAQQRAMGR